MFRICLAICLTLLIVTSAFAQETGETPAPEYSYIVCDWGLLTIENPTEQPAIFLTIDSPAAFSAVPGTSFTVSGTGAGMFEGNVVVEAIANGAVIFSAPTTLQAPDVGAPGTWSIEVDLGALEGPTLVFVRAFSPSPEDGSDLAAANIDINVNSEFSLPFVDITTPGVFAAGVNASPLLVEGMAGSVFENNLVIEVLDSASGDALSETFATVQSDAVGGRGTFSAEVTVDAIPGTAVTIRAYQPPIADGEEITVSDTEFAVINPLGQTYDRFLYIRASDPLNNPENPCSATGTEFDNTSINPLAINDVQVISTRSIMPLVNVSIDAAGSSNCPAPLRTRITRDGDAFAIETYYDASQPVACTADLAPLPQSVSLGMLPNPDYTITVNGQPVE